MRPVLERCCEEVGGGKTLWGAGEITRKYGGTPERKVNQGDDTPTVLCYGGQGDRHNSGAWRGSRG